MEILRNSERPITPTSKANTSYDVAETPANFEKFVDLASKLAALGAKVGVFIGALCFGIYCVRIGYFPSDVSLGDGFLFLLMACSFGVLYLLFVASLVSLGVVASPGLRPILNGISKGGQKWKAYRGNKSHFDRTTNLAVAEWPGFDSSAIPFAFIGVLFIWGFTLVNFAALWTLPLSAVALYVLYSIYWSNSRKLAEISRRQKSSILREHEVVEFEDTNKLRTLRNQAGFFMLVTPMLVTGVMSSVLDSTMRAVHLRQEHVTVYLSAPYADLVPDSHLSSNLKGYGEIKDATVLLHGLGKNTVLLVKIGGDEHELVVPDDKLIISMK